MFERFTDSARRVIVLAQEEARRLNHNYIGTEHLLLGLLHGDTVATRALTELGIDLDAVRSQVEDIIGLGDKSMDGHIPFTPRAKKVLELSLREAIALSHNYIGPEHILLAASREGEGVAAQVLVKLGADPKRLRPQVMTLIGIVPESEQPEHTHQVPVAAAVVTLLQRVQALEDRVGELERLLGEQRAAGEDDKPA
ncbi:hypothetical protein Ntsu_50040 [Nocardia sp. IFM 10818]